MNIWEIVDFDILVITLILIVLDLIFGFIGAVKEKKVNSEKLRQGLWHKSGFIGLICLGYIIEFASTKIELGFEIPTVLGICIYIIVTEIISIFENLCILNPNLVNSPLGSIFHNVPKVEDAEKLENTTKQEGTD